jgi:hypothetical protein
LDQICYSLTITYSLTTADICTQVPSQQKVSIISHTLAHYVCVLCVGVGASGSAYATKDKGIVANKVNLYVYGDPECMSEEINDHHFLTRYTA